MILGFQKQEENPKSDVNSKGQKRERDSRVRSSPGPVSAAYEAAVIIIMVGY